MKISAKEYQDRCVKTRSFFDRWGVDAFVFQHLPDVRYLSGFSGTAGTFILLRKKSVFLTDSRYTVQADKEVKADKIIIIRQRGLEGVKKVLGGFDRIGFDSKTVSVFEKQALIREMKGKKWKGIPAPLSSLREVKSSKEIKVLAESCQLICEAIRQVMKRFPIKSTEKEVALRLEEWVVMHGGEKMAFESIVASGSRSAMPHGIASGARFPQKGFLTIDCGAVIQGYHSDITRTFYLGRPTAKARALYQAVFKAQSMALSVIRSGAAMKAPHLIATKVLKKNGGFDRYFGHGLGHGVGLEIHEGPILGPNSSGVFREGMVITVEPGAYLPGYGGVRIEDTVVVTKKGIKILTDFPKQLIYL